MVSDTIAMEGENLEQVGFKSSKPSESQMMRKENDELRTELHVNQAERIEFEMETTMLREENEDLRAENARLKLRLAKSENDRKRAFDKYNTLLDEMRLDPSEQEKRLNEYRRKAEDLEDAMAEQRKAWKTTGDLLKKQTEEYQEKAVDLREEISSLNERLEEERKRGQQLQDDVEIAQTEKEEFQKKVQDMELKLASSSTVKDNVADMYRQQSSILRQMSMQRSGSEDGNEDELTNDSSDLVIIHEDRNNEDSEVVLVSH